VAGRRQALIVAVDEYEHPGLRRLRSPTADAEALAAALGDPRIGDFEVSVVRNEPAHEIQSRLEDLFADAHGDDVLLVHFSGHGLKGEAGDLYFAARNTRPSRLASTAVPADFVQRCVRASPSRSIVLLLDCCYGGAFSQGVSVRAAGDVAVLDSFPTGKLGGGRGRAVITASTAMEYAFEGEQLSPDSHPSPSLFTSALVHGLTTGEADLDEDGLVSLNELYAYVFDQVRARNPNQTPSRDIEMQGELYLAKSGRRRVRPSPVPPDLQAASQDPNPYARLGAVAELRARLLSENLPVAAGAFETLQTMASTDTRLVAEAATAAIAEMCLRVRPVSLNLGSAPVGMPGPPAHLEVSGPPLTRALTVQPSEPWIRWSERPDGYDVWAQVTRPGPHTGAITLKGPTDELELPVTVDGRIPGRQVDGAPEETTVQLRTADDVDQALNPPGTTPEMDPSTPTASPTEPPQVETSPPLPPAHHTEPSPTADVAGDPRALEIATPETRQPPASEIRETGAEQRVDPGSSPSPLPHAARQPANAVFIGSCILAALFALPTVPSFLEDTETNYVSVSALSVLVGACLAITRRFRALGAGLAVAGATLASWWIIQLLLLASIFNDSGNVGWWTTVIVFNFLVITACTLLYRQGRRGQDLQVRRPAWALPTVKLFAGIGLAGAVGLIIHAIQLVSAVNGQHTAWILTSNFWLAALTAGVPVLAIGAEPRRFRNGLLLGWLLSSIGILSEIIRLESYQDIDIAKIGLAIYGVSLLTELVVIVRIWKRPTQHGLW
jgi:hypothetical protein